MELDQQFTLNFAHPTDSTRLLTATVGGGSTASYLIGELVRSGFLPKAPDGTAYKLLDPTTLKELGDNQTITSAEIPQHSTLYISHNVTGAAAVR